MRRWPIPLVAQFICIVLLSGSFLVFGQARQKQEAPLAKLISGSSSDLTGTLSTLPEADLPLALAVTEALKFKALHNDTQFSADEVEAFRQGVIHRLSQAKTISLSASDLCSVPVPVKTTTLNGINLTVPAHFTLSGDLRILEVMPTGEAGSLLPDFLIRFHTGFLPVSAKLFVDGRPFSEGSGTASPLLFRPEAAGANLLAIGTHTASITMTDQAGKTVTTSWPLSVGLHPVPTPPIPGDAKLIGSFTLDAPKVMVGADPETSIRVTIFETVDGRRIIEYVIHPQGEPDRILAKTMDPNWLRRLLDPKRKDQSLTLSPKTHFAFAGNKILFGASYSGEGTVQKVSWVIHEDDTQVLGEGPSIAWVLKKETVRAVCSMVVAQALPDGTVSSLVLSERKDISPLWPLSSFSESAIGLFTPTGAIGVKVWRFLNREKAPLQEGAAFEFFGGIITVDKARLNIGSGSGGTIANPVALATSVSFSKPGVCEIVDDIALSFQYEDEHYEGIFAPECSMLVGAFNVTGNMSFSRVPPGIIQGTTRKVTVESISVKVNEEVRQFGKPEVNWELARSTLFPGQPSIAINTVLPGFKILISSFYPDFKPAIGGFLSVEEDANGNAVFHPLIKVVPNFSQNPSTVIQAQNNLLVPYFSLDASILGVDTTPSNSPPIQEGQEICFHAAIVPRVPGTGSIDEDGGTINILEGYEVSGIRYLFWSDIPEWLEEQPHKRQELEWQHVFRPEWGSGTYAIKSSVWASVRETETGDEVSVAGSDRTRVVVLPGLRLKSPLGNFAYPLDTTIPIETTLDDNPDLWRQISWTLNGKSWNPPGDDPKPRLTLDKQDTWSLQAELDLSTATQTVILSDAATFTVKPIDLRLSPARKVVSYPGPAIPLALNVLLNGHQVETLGDAVPWKGEALTAEVEKIAWCTDLAPAAAADISPEDPPFAAELAFKQKGAATILATVSLRIRPVDGWKPSNKEPSDPETWVFAVPAVRADAWAVPKPTNVEIKDGVFPEKALGEAHRTFELKSLAFHLAQDEYTWSKDSDLQPPITLRPAIPFVMGGFGPRGEVKLSWKGPENQASTEALFQPLMPLGGYAVTMDSVLSFGNDALPLLTKEVSGKAEDYYQLVRASIDPASFPIWVGQQQTLTFIIESIDQPSPDVPPAEPPSGPVKTPIQLQGGNFQAEIETVTWETNGSVLGTGNPYDYFAKGKAVETITGKGKVKVTEAKTSPVAKPSLFDHSADTKTTIGRIIAYPSNGYVFPASYAITLQARSDAPDPETIEWSVDGNHVGRGVTVPVNGLSVGTHKIQAVHPGNNYKEERFISVFPWSVSFSPARSVLLAPKQGQSAQQGFDFKVKIKDAFIASGSVVSIKFLKDKDAAVSVSALGVAYVAKEPQCASATVSGQKGTATFSKDGAITILPKGTFSVTQFDGATKEYTLLQKNRADFWAVQQPTWWAIDGHFPLKAILNAKRTFQFKNGEFRLSGDQKYVWAPKKPIDPDLELDPAFKTDGKPLVADKITLFWKKGSEDTETEGATFTPFLDTAGSTTITLNAKLLFDTGEVEFEPQEFETNAVPLATLVQAVVVPASFSIPVGKTQELNFFLRGDGAAAMTTVTCATKTFEVSLTHLTWQKNGKTFALNENPTNFSQDQVGSGVIDAIASISIRELDVIPSDVIGVGLLWANASFEVLKRELIVKKEGSNEAINFFETGYRKLQTKFSAYERFGGDETPIRVTWRLIEGDATTTLRLGILNELDSNVGKIGVLSDGIATYSIIDAAEKTSFFSLLPGNISLEIEDDKQTKKTVRIRIKQPSLRIFFRALTSQSQIPYFDLWRNTAKSAWEKEGLFSLDFLASTPAYFDNREFDPVLDPFQSYEYFLASQTGRLPSLLDVIVFDDRANGHFGHPLVLTRQAEELAHTDRKSDPGINVYIGSHLLSSQFNPFDPLNPLGSHPGGWTVSSDDSFLRQSMPQKVSEGQDSAIFLINPEINSATSTHLFLSRYFAHELGHILIQSGNEHTVDGQIDGNPWPTTNLMSETNQADLLVPRQLIQALGYEKKEVQPYIIEK